MNPNYSNRGLTILIATYNASAMIEGDPQTVTSDGQVPGLPWEVLLLTTIPPMTYQKPEFSGIMAQNSGLSTSQNKEQDLHLFAA